jgi:putative membrane protein
VRRRVRPLPAARLGGLTLLSFLRSPLPAAAIAALALIPLLYSGLYLWAFWDPFGRVDRLPVALVNQDRPAAADGREVRAGDELERELLRRGDLDWHAVDAPEAADGLADGRYYVVFTIPGDFSADLVSPADDAADPVPATLRAHFDDSNNYIVRELLTTGLDAIRAAAGSAATGRYLDRIFLAFNELHDRTADAADGAEELAGGAADAEDGAADLDSGLGDAEDGADTLAGGLDVAEEGAADLDSGLGDAEDGAGALAGGLGDAADGAADLDSGLGDAEDGAADLDSGLLGLRDGSRTLADGATEAAGEVDAAVDVLDTLADTWVPRVRADAPAVEAAAEAAAEAADTLAAALDALPEVTGEDAAAARALCVRLEDRLDAHPDLAGEDPELHALLVDAHAAAALAADLADLVHTHRDRIAGLARDAGDAARLAAALAADAPGLADDAEAARDRADTLSTALDDLAEGARDLRDGLATASSGASDLRGGLGDLHTGADALSGGLGDLDGGADELYGGLGELRGGAGELSGGLGELSGGADDLDGGLARLRSGADDLDSGLGDLAEGSRTLADGLADGAGDIPTYGEDAREVRGDVMGRPVRLASSVDHPAPDYGTGFAPFFIALALWVGAMVAYIVLPALTGRALAAAAPSWRVALAGWLPALAVGAVQVAVMLAALHLLLGLEARRWPALVGVLLLTAAAYTAVNQALNAALGAPGKVVALVLLMLQLTTAGGTYPLQTSPGFFAALAPYLPMWWVVSALRHLISGGGTAVVEQACWVLAAYLAGALLVTWAAAARRRSWTVGALHPVLRV